MKPTAPQAPSAVSTFPVFSELLLRREIPAWLLSLALHLLLVLAAGMAVRWTPRGIATEADRTAGIVLVKHAHGDRQYFDQEDARASESSDPAAVGTSSPFPDAAELAIDVSSLLPAPGEGVGDLSDAFPSGPRAGQLAGRTGRGIDLGGTARTEVFGVYGEGTRFVYLFDRSGSMDGFGGRPLRAAKKELVASLADLGRIHQFQIIFYNEAPKVFNPHGGRPRLEWADDASKQLASAFVRSISAAGGTHHLSALRLALSLQPDVIFFLTDADEPKLSAVDLNGIRRRNRGSSIHAVEFGFGPQRNRDNFLVRLAEQNGGQHVYVDISELPSGP